MKLRINEVLEEKGMSVAELGRRVGVSRASMHNTISKDNPTIETLQSIAKALEVPITSLFKSEESEDLSALIDRKNKLYRATTQEELENLVIDFSLEETLSGINESVLNSLNKELREPITLYIQGKTYTEIGERLNLPLETVKSRIFFAKMELKSILKEN